MAARKREKKPKREGKPEKRPDVEVKVDRALKKAYDEQLAVIQAATHEETRMWDRLWEAAGHVVEHDPPLYVVGGYASADEFYREVCKEEPRNARRYVRVAKLASPAEETRYGVAKLDAVLGFIEAKIGHPLADPPLPVSLDRVRIPTNEGLRAIEHASFAEITAATRALRRKAGKARATPAKTAIEAALRKVRPLSKIEVSEHAGLVSFARVPLAALERFARAMLTVRLPEEPKKAAKKKRPG